MNLIPNNEVMQGLNTDFYNLYHYYGNRNPKLFNQETPFVPINFQTRVPDYNMKPIPNVIFENYPEELFYFIGDKVVPNIMKFRYLISNKGRVYDRVHDRFMTFCPNRGFFKFKVAYYINPDTLGSKDVYLHTALFLSVYDVNIDGYEIDYINGNSADNRIENLQLLSKSEYSKKMYSTGRRQRALSNDDAKTAIKMLLEGYSNSKVADTFKVSPDIIKDLKSRKSYEDIYEELGLHGSVLDILRNRGW